MIPERGDRLLPAVSALLAVCAFPPFHLLFPSFVALVPLALWVADCQVSHRAFRGGVWFGVLYFGVLLYWIPIALAGFTWWAVPAYVAVVVLLAFGAGGFAWALFRLTHGGGLPLWVALPLTWTALEWIRAHAPGGLAFPWLGLGTSLTGYPELVGAAELVGARGITLWLALLNGLTAEAVRAARARDGARASLRWAAAFAVVLAVPAAWGYWRAETLPVRAIGEVAVVQPNVAARVRLDRLQSNDSTAVSLTRLALDNSGPPPDLVVWPEMTFFGSIESDRPLRERVAEVAGRWRAPVVFGAIGETVVPGRAPVPMNSAFLMDREGRLGDFRYDKHRLVPVVENTPFRRGGWREGGVEVDSYGAGVDWILGEMGGGVRFGVLICYESTYASHARRLRLEGADFFLNLTNDGWFGQETWYTRTTALWQHPAHLVMRAIEHRVGVARAANTGISFFVDPLGVVYGETDLFQAAVRSETVYTSDVMTWYTRTGDMAGWTALVLTLGLLAMSRPRVGSSTPRPTHGPA